MSIDLSDDQPLPLPLDSIPPETLLGRAQVGVALKARGILFVSTDTLATKATRGGGPPFKRFGKQAVYRWADVVAWVHETMGEAARTTAERRGRAGL